MIASNDHDPVPANADLYIHLSPKVSSKPWLDSEATPTNAPGGYWSTYSKETNAKTAGTFYAFLRIGRSSRDIRSREGGGAGSNRAASTTDSKGGRNEYRPRAASSLDLARSQTDAALP